jgi:phospholipid-binding lipoprotein MlaA
MACLLTVAGCSSSARKQQNVSTTTPSDANSSENDIFSEFEEEMTQSKVTIPDPLKPFNHLMFNVNDILYFWIAKPIVQGYSGVMPKPARIGIDNFFFNLETPARLVNCLLQAKFSAAGREVYRFGINTTIGVLGLGDPAKDRWGLEPSKEDLGQTLAVYGFGNGFYIVWPLLGPSTLRDSLGLGGDAFLNPVRYVRPEEVSIGISAVDLVNDGSFHIGDYESFKAASIDPYVAMRNAYVQYRNNLIKE